MVTEDVLIRQCQNEIADEKAAVVIPVYKEKLSKTEEVSLSQALKILGDYDFCFICPKSLEYEYGDIRIREIRFDDIWFSSVRKYSELMLQKVFYQKFAEYDYILIYQLDAFVFSDRLRDFCRRGYDYIGGPWIHGLVLYRDASHIIHFVGNGGFSLRRVSAFLLWLEETDLSAHVDTINEDILIATYGRPMLKIPGVREALEFSFDMDPKRCFEMNGNKLPFGCHAWQRLDFNFWRPFIEVYGHDLGQVADSGLSAHYRLRHEKEEEANSLIYRLSNEARIRPRMKQLTCYGKRRLYIWGTGLFGTLAGRIFAEYGIAYGAFIDNQKKQKESHLGYPVLWGPDFLKKKSAGHTVFIAVVRTEDIIRQMEAAGYRHGWDYISLWDLE